MFIKKEQPIVDIDSDEFKDVIDECIKEVEAPPEIEKMGEELSKLKDLVLQLPDVIIDNRKILDAVSILSNNVSLYINRNTVEINAEAATDSIVIKRLTSIKGDTLSLNGKSSKSLMALNASWLILGACIGLLGDYWMPYVDDNIGSVVKWVVNLFIK